MTLYIVLRYTILNSVAHCFAYLGCIEDSKIKKRTSHNSSMRSSSIPDASLWVNVSHVGAIRQLFATGAPNLPTKNLPTEIR